MCKICPTVDFHTHLDRQHPLKVPANTVRIISVPQEEAALPLPEKCFATLELHPWSGAMWSENVAEMAKDSRFIGIGEVGLDRLKGKLSIAEQMLIFSHAANLAQKLNKPLTIHCVKCFSELLNLYKNIKWQVPTIIHYFCGKLELAQQLWQDTHFILSLPPKITVQTRLLEFLRANPQYHNRIVLETDDPVSGDIHEHYKTMASALELSLPQLTQLMEEQFERVYHAGNIR